MKTIPEGANSILANRKRGMRPECVFIGDEIPVKPGVDYDWRFIAKLPQVVFIGKINDDLMGIVENMFKQLKGAQPSMIHVWDKEMGGIQCWYLPDDVENCADWTMTFCPWTDYQNQKFREQNHGID